MPANFSFNLTAIDRKPVKFKMKSIATVASLVAVVAAAADPLITPGPRAEMAPRQDTKSDPAALGWVSAASGACKFLSLG
jgi:hypothetical protein